MIIIISSGILPINNFLIYKNIYIYNTEATGKYVLTNTLGGILLLENKSFMDNEFSYLWS